MPNTDSNSDDSFDLIFGTIAPPPPRKALTPTYRPTEKQRKNIAVLARTLYMAGQRVDSQSIWQTWPDKDPDPDIRIKAGERPTKDKIAQFMETTEFAAQMAALGVEYSDKASGLTPTQSALLTTLSDITDRLSLKQKLAKHNVTWPTYQSWLKQRIFGEYHAKLLGESLKLAIPAAEVQLAQRMAGGDLAAIKYGFEVTGRHDPANKKQVDAQQLVGILLEVIDSEVKDPDTRARIGDRLKILSVGAITG